MDNSRAYEVNLKNDTDLINPTRTMDIIMTIQDRLKSLCNNHDIQDKYKFYKIHGTQFKKNVSTINEIKSKHKKFF